MPNRILTLCLLAICTWTAAQTDVAPLQLGSAPARSVTLYVGSDRALIQEQATVWLRAGANDVRLRWVDAGLDVASLDLQAPADVQVSTSRVPAGETNTVAWTLTAPTAGPRTVTCSYFLKGLGWSPTYEVIYDPATGVAALSGKLHLQNDTKLPLRGAAIRLLPAPTACLESAAASPTAYWELSDLHLLPGWQLRVPFLPPTPLPAQVLYRADWEANKQDVCKVLQIDLRALSLPGPLPKGHVEVLQKRDGTLLPVASSDLEARADKPTELDLGVEPSVVFERKVTARHKQGIEYDKAGRVAGYDSVEEIAVSLRNRTADDVRIELIEKTPGKTTVACKLAAAEENPNDPNQITWPLTLKAGQSVTVTYTITRKVGSKGD
jgi:hypothetical protein